MQGWVSSCALNRLESLAIVKQLNAFACLKLTEMLKFSGRDGRDGREGPAGLRGIAGPKGI